MATRHGNADDASGDASEDAGDGGMDIAPLPDVDGRPAARLRKRRADEWTAATTADFLAHLTATANVEASAKAVGKSVAEVYLRRRRLIAFRRAWEAALAEGYAQLEATLLDRAINGRRTTKVTRQGKRVAHVAYSDSLGLRLLTLHRRSVAESRATDRPKPDDPKVLRARMASMIDKLVAGLPDRPLALPAPPVNAGDGGDAGDAAP